MRAQTGLKAATRHSGSAARASALPVSLLGESDAVRRARLALELAAGRHTPVLLLAEPGCRPGSVVEFLHARSGQRVRVLALDCGAAEPADIDRRLFGA